MEIAVKVFHGFHAGNSRAFTTEFHSMYHGVSWSPMGCRGLRGKLSFSMELYEKFNGTLWNSTELRDGHLHISLDFCIICTLSVWTQESCWKTVVVALPRVMFRAVSMVFPAHETPRKSWSSVAIGWCSLELREISRHHMASSAMEIHSKRSPLPWSSMEIRGRPWKITCLAMKLHGNCRGDPSSSVGLHWLPWQFVWNFMDWSNSVSHPFFSRKKTDYVWPASLFHAIFSNPTCASMLPRVRGSPRLTVFFSLELLWALPEHYVECAEFLGYLGKQR